MPIRLWGREKVLNNTQAGTQNDEQLIALRNGGAVAVWFDSTDGGDIRARVLDGAGEPITGEIAVASGPFIQNRPAAAVLGDGSFSIAWEENGSVNVRNFAADGTPGVSVSISGASNPSIFGADVSTKAGYVAYETPTGDIALARLGAAGEILTIGIPVNTTTAEIQSAPSVASNGLVMVAWFTGTNTTLEIRARILNPDGTPYMDRADFSVQTGVTGTNVINPPDVTPLSDGNFAVAYRGSTAGFGNFTSYYRVEVFTRDGVQLSTITATSFGQGAPNISDGDVVQLQNGNLLIAWAEGGQVYAQEYSLGGTATAPRIPVSTSGSVATTVSLALLADGRVSVVWSGSTPTDPTAILEQILDPRDGFIYGTNAAETVYGGPAGDQIVTLGGNDRVFAMEAPDIVYSGAGADFVLGDLGDDVLYGGDDNDQLNGGTGDDALYGEFGSDVMVGELGDDLLFGQDGNDTMNASAGQDALYGGDGDDVLLGENGDDAFFGGEGADVIYGGRDGDVLNGENGGDSLLGEAGDDLLDGGGGGDALDGGAGVDNLLGGADGDVLIGGADGDRLEGGPGSDVYWYRAPSEGNDLIVGFVSADDQLQFSGSAFGFAPGATLVQGQTFIIGSGPTQAGPTFVYNNGALYFDADGLGGPAGLVFIALLQGAPTVTAADFQFV